MRGGVPGRHPDRQPGDRAAQGARRRARAGHGETSACAASRRGGARTGRPDRPGAACAGPAFIDQPGAGVAPPRAGQDRPDQDFHAEKDRGGGCGAPLARGAAMNFAYYPGCSARSTCAELNEAMQEVSTRLGLTLTPLESATCTGARELRAIDPVGFYTLNVRILALAEREGLPLMTVCNTCTLNLLDAHAAFVGDPELAGEVDGRLAVEGLCYSGRTRISHFLWVL